MDYLDSLKTAANLSQELGQKLRSVSDVSQQLSSYAQDNLHSIFVLDMCRDQALSVASEPVLWRAADDAPKFHDSVAVLYACSVGQRADDRDATGQHGRLTGSLLKELQCGMRTRLCACMPACVSECMACVYVCRQHDP